MISFRIQGLHFIVFVASIVGIMAEENTQLQAVLKGNGELTKNVYNILARKPGNVFFSPISIHAVLSMAAQGSKGTTANDFTQVLGVPSLQTAADGYQNVMQRLNSAANVSFHIANKIFVMQSYNLNNNFKAVVADKFLSEVENINFADSGAAATTINRWVENKTHDKIKNVITKYSLDVNTRLVLVNAIYFKGQWQNKFYSKLTTREKFYVNDKDTIDVQMMHITEKFLYKDDESLNAKVLEMPYTNSDFSMVIILPNERNGIAALKKKLAETDLTKITENMYMPKVVVSLPKFKIEETMDLKDTLTEIGLGGMFTDSADFSGMLESSERLLVSNVVQKAFIEVNEEGAEAAAATGEMIVATGCTIPEEFNADHAFIVVLFAKQQIVLFYGNIFQPTVAEGIHDEL